MTVWASGQYWMLRSYCWNSLILLKGGTTLIAQLSWVIYLTLSLTHNQPAHSYVAYSASHRQKECAHNIV